MQRTIEGVRADITLRRMLPQDLPSLQALSHSIGWPHRLQDWAQFYSLGEGLVACTSEGAVLASAMLWRWSPSFVTMGLVLVSSKWQGQGIGRRLMRALLSAVPDAAVMLHATEAGIALYESLGFRSTGKVFQHQGTIFEPMEPSALRRAKGTELQALVAGDRVAFGAARLALMEQCLAEGDISLLERDGGLAGFAVRRRFGRGEMIGPMVAADEDDAIALLGATLQPGFQRIDIPADAKRLAAWLTGAGLPMVDSVTVMIRGVWPPVLGGMRRFALASQAFG